MRTISWKHSVIALFAVASFAACSDDTTSGPPADSGPDTVANPCGNGKIDTGEDCDGTKLNGMTCASMSMGMKTGTLGCTSKCKYDTSKCMSGGGGMGGGGGGTGGSGNAGTGGSVGGSGMKTDGGLDAGDGGGKKDSGGGKTDSGGGKTDSGSTPTKDAAPTD